MKKLFFALFLLSSAAYGQTVTTPFLYQTIDSMSATLDSITIKMKLAPAAGISYNLDTLVLPVNSSGIFTVTYFSYDTTAHFTGKGMQIIGVDRVGNNYSSPEIIYSSPYYTNGLSTHQVFYSCNLINGLPIVQAQGYGNGIIIRWHVMKEAKISPL